MDMYKLKWTRLQNEIFRLLCIKAGTSVNQRGIARALKVSPTAVANSLSGLEKEGLIKIERKEDMNLISIQLNRDNQRAIELKRIENLKIIYESELVRFLEEKFPGTVIILFGSFSYGEDTFKSDIDIAVIGGKQKEINLEKFEKILEREININIYQDIKDINKNLKSNISNGVVLVGRISI